MQGSNSTLVTEKEELTSLFVSRLESKDFSDLACLFTLIKQDLAAKNFHPHPFTVEQARIITQYNGQDLYLGAFEQNKLIGYGLLRGWDANYAIPSLGIYLAPSVRGRGLAAQLMTELHRQALHKNASAVRLKVYPENKAALHLYQRLGYLFTSQENGQLIGYLDLKNNC